MIYNELGKPPTNAPGKPASANSPPAIRGGRYIKKSKRKSKGKSKIKTKRVKSMYNSKMK